MALFEARRVLKADAVRNLGTRVAFNYDDLTTQCEQKIAEVRRQAEELLRNAEQQANEIRENAQAEGYRAGFEQGMVKADSISNEKGEKIAQERFQKEWSDTLPLVRQVASELNARREEWLAQWETAAIRLSACIASKVVHQAVAFHPELCTVNAREALKLAAGKSKVSLRMHPEDLEVLGDRMNEITQALNWTGQLPVIPDTSVGRGGCVVQTEHGEVDARLDEQIERISRELLG